VEPGAINRSNPNMAAKIPSNSTSHQGKVASSLSVNVVILASSSLLL
jgi:hypothetical protein